MKRSLKLLPHAQTKRRREIRPLLELLESRLQPGSMVLGQGTGASLLAESLPNPNAPSLATGALFCETAGENTAQQPHTVTIGQGNAPLPVATPSTRTSQEPAFLVPGRPLVDSLTPDWLNDNLARLLTPHQDTVTPVVISEAGRPSDGPSGAASLAGGVAPSPVGVASPPTTLSTPASANGMMGNSQGVTPQRLPMPTPTSLASSVQAGHLQETRIDLPVNAQTGTIHAQMTMQNFSTLLGGSGEDGLRAVGTDSAGNIYVAGYLEAQGQVNVLVASLNPSGNAFNWAPALLNDGTGLRDEAHGLTVVNNPDGSVSLYVVGSLANGNPVTQSDAFLAVLDGATGSLQNNVTLANADAEGVAVDVNNGDVFVSGTAADPGSGATGVLAWAEDPTLDQMPLFAVSLGLQDANGQNVNSFAIGGQSLAIDSMDNLYIIGTLSNADGSDTSPLVLAYNGFTTSFPWAPLNYPNSGTGGLGGGGAIWYDPQTSSLFLTGTLADNNPPTVLNSDLLLARLTASGGSQLFGTQWVVVDGGTRDGDWTGNGIAVNGNFEPIVTGAALDPTGTSTSGPTNGVDVHVTHFGPGGNITLPPDNRPQNTFGGMAMDQGYAVVLDPNNANSVIVVGTTQSRDFPTTSSAVEPTYNGGFSDGFVASVPV